MMLASVCITLTIGLAGCPGRTEGDGGIHDSTSRVVVQGPPVDRYSVKSAWPHDTGAYTQGLLFHQGYLYESTGLEGRSSLRRVNIETGAIEQRVDLRSEIFAEGIAIQGDRIYQLTWRNRVGFIYELKTLKLIGQFGFYNEGWGLTTDGSRLYMSDGTNTLRVLSPDSLRVDRTIPVFDGDRPIDALNELEWVEGEIWANIWQTDLIARIDPSTGKVIRYVNLSGILPPQDRRPGIDVLNGIAYDPATRRIWVTGKLWPRLFEIEVVPSPAGFGPAIR